MHDFNTTSSCLSKNDIICLLNDKVLGHIEAINSGIEIFLVIISIFLMLYLSMVGFKFINIKQIKDSILIEIRQDITDRLYLENIEQNKNIRKSILKNHKTFQKDEYLRNLIFYDLSKTLATNINEDGEKDLKKVFNLYSTRLLIATQLTSGDSKKIKISLTMLALPAYSVLLSLLSVQNYIKTLELIQDELEIDEELEAIKQRMQKNNSIF